MIDEHRLRSIKALFLDCDGVLTNGEITYDHEARRSLSFYARDGLGLVLLRRSGIKIAIVSGRPADIAELRYREIGIDRFVGRCIDKAAGLRTLSDDLDVELDECAFVGDDLADLPAFRVCGAKIAVADAAQELAIEADWVTTAPGGRGAVREVCEVIMRAQGTWDPIVAKLRDGK